MRPHVTLVYPEEFNDEDLLMVRAQEAASRFGPFTMHSEAVVTGGEDGSGGLFASIADPTGSWLALRQTILQPPFEPIDISPHVTLVHPRTSRRCAEAWSEPRGVEVASQLVVHEFCLTSKPVPSWTADRER